MKLLSISAICLPCDKSAIFFVLACCVLLMHISMHIRERKREREREKEREREREIEILTGVKTQRDRRHFVHICVGH